MAESLAPNAPLAPAREPRIQLYSAAAMNSGLGCA